MDALKVLQDARALIDRPYGFKRGDMHSVREVKGQSIDCYCAVGAVRKASHHDPQCDGYGIRGTAYSKAISFLARVASPGSSGGEWRITAYNDCHKKAEVLALFDDAIALAQKENS